MLAVAVDVAASLRMRCTYVKPIQQIRGGFDIMVGLKFQFGNNDEE